jgi:tetratricopeptide (TPR) repeat protein
VRRGRPVSGTSLETNVGQTSPHPLKLNQVSSHSSWRKALLSLRSGALVLLLCTDLVSRVAAADAQKSLRGSITIAPGMPAAATVVELWDLHGEKKASAITDRTGTFDIAGPLEPGEYVLLVDSGCHISSQQVRMVDPDVEVNLVLPTTREIYRVGSAYAVPAPQLGVPAKARAHLQAADRSFRRAKFDQAMTEIDSALRIDPEYALALALRAVIWLGKKDPSRASEDAQLAVSLDPGAADAFIALAISYDSLGKFNEGELAAERALALRPDSWQARLELAKSFYKLGDFVVALRELDLAKIDFPDAHVVRANVLLALGRKNEAGDELRAFLRQAPDDPRRQQVENIVTILEAFPAYEIFFNF